MRIENVGQINYNSNPVKDTSVNINKLETNDNSYKEELKVKDAKLSNSRDSSERELEGFYSKDEVISMIEDANEEFVTYDRKFEFAIHEKTKQITVKVLDSVTDEVIRELPPEKILDMLAGIWEVAGILVDETI